MITYSLISKNDAGSGKALPSMYGEDQCNLGRAQSSWNFTAEVSDTTFHSVQGKHLTGLGSAWAASS